MVGVLFDTNIYGKIIADNTSDSLLIAESIERDKEFIIHNFKVVRDELRKAPKILPLYDRLTCQRVIVVEKIIEKLANLYFKEYRESGGIQKKIKIL